MFAIHVDGTAAFDAELARLLGRGEEDFVRVEPAVREILAAVRARGDAAVLDYTERFDARRPTRLAIREFGGAEALARLAPSARDALELAAQRIRSFHQHQRDSGFAYVDGGVALGTRVRPVRRAGIYAPGGKARYPSSVLMSAIPAQVAGVPEIVLATPLGLGGGGLDDLMFAAAYLSGVTLVVDAGGAQAIAALAYGTESVPRVDKIVGPGNAFVACAKRLVFGAVSIDTIAGPSEILVLADEAADPRVVAADLLSQAEHDEAAYAMVACTSVRVAKEVVREVESQLATLPRAAIARASIEANGRVFVVGSRERLADLANAIAPEHLSLQVGAPRALMDQIDHAGAAFLGGSTPEAAGDYLAGPSHVLPTGGAVRFGSPLGVYDFLTRTSMVEYSADALAVQAGPITAFARLEGLEAHARAVEIRIGRSS